MARQLVDAPVVKGQRYDMTYEEWLERVPENILSEWVDGEVIVFMPPSELHQDLAGFLFVLVSWYARTLGLGKAIIAPFEMRLSNRLSREPDIVFVAREHIHRLDGKRLAGPADLAVEVVWPDSVTRDRREKLAEYDEAGVREYWLVDTRPGHEDTRFFQRSAAGRFEPAAADADGRYRSAVLPGFWFRPDWLWQEPLPDPVALLPIIAPEAWRAAFETTQPD